MTVTLYTVAEGAAYAPFAPRWWESVRRMDPLPDEVVIVIGADDHAGIRELVTPDVNTVIVQLEEPFSNSYFRAGVNAATSEWIAFSGIDDQMLPHAFVDIPTATRLAADVIVGTIFLSNGGMWRGSWDPAAMRHVNTLPAHSPFRQSIYERVGGFPDIRWSDWGFWLRCAAAGARPYQGTQPIAIFDIGEGRETMSGVSLQDHIRKQADAELKAFAESL